MTEQPATHLDTFETALLSELTEELRRDASPTAGSAPRQRQPRKSHRRGWIAAAATAAAALVVVTQVPGLGPAPAYAVTGRNDVEITVRVNRLEGAEGLEQALRARGIAADITYLPPGKECAPNRYIERHPPGMVLSVALTWFEVTIPRGSVGKDDTFVLSASVVPIPNGFQATTDFGIANGQVQSCQVIDSP